MHNGLITLENSLAYLKNLNVRVIIWLSNFTPNYIPKRTENICLHKSLYMNIHSSSIYNSKELEINPLSINGWTEKQKVAYSSNGILFTYKKGWRTATRYTMDEPATHYAQRKKSDMKGHILCNSVYMKCPELGKTIETDSRWAVARNGGNHADCLLATMGFLFGVMKIFWNQSWWS